MGAMRNEPFEANDMIKQKKNINNQQQQKNFAESHFFIFSIHDECWMVRTLTYHVKPVIRFNRMQRTGFQKA